MSEPILRAVCSWCKVVYREGDAPKPVTHGSCPACTAGLLAGIAAEKIVRDYFAKPGWLESDDFTTDVTRAFRMLS